MHGQEQQVQGGIYPDGQCPCNQRACAQHAHLQHQFQDMQTLSAEHFQQAKFRRQSLSEICANLPICGHLQIRQSLPAAILDKVCLQICLQYALILAHSQGPCQAMRKLQWCQPLTLSDPSSKALKTSHRKSSEVPPTSKSSVKEQRLAAPGAVRGGLGRNFLLPPRERPRAPLSMTSGAWQCCRLALCRGQGF